MVNELFGHEKDAYTDAGAMRHGLLESADGGVVLFDEIGEMPLTMQVKLLRVLQEKKIIRVGGTKEIPIDVRILAATNRDLKEEIEKGNVSSGSVLSAQCRPSPYPAASGEKRRHSTSG